METYRTIKLRIYPSDLQKLQIDRILNSLSFLWDYYLNSNFLMYEKYHKTDKRKTFISYWDFDKYLRGLDVDNLPSWYKYIPAVSRQHMLHNADKSFRKFFKKKSNRPKFKSIKRNPVQSFYFPKMGLRLIDQDHIWVPYINPHKMKFSDKGFISKYNSLKELNISSGRIIKDNYGRYFMMILHKVFIAERGYDFNMDLRKTISLQFGLGNYCYIKHNFEYDEYISPWIENPKLKIYSVKIQKLAEVLKLKTQTRKKNKFSNKYNKVRIRILSYYKKINDYMDNYMKKLCLDIFSRYNPKEIIIPDLGFIMRLNKKGATEVMDILYKHQIPNFVRILAPIAEKNNCKISKSKNLSYIHDIDLFQ